MGMETAAVVLAAISTGATIGKMGMEINAANARTKVLESQALQNQVQTQQKTLENYDQILKVLDAQKALMTTRGVAFSSPSFNAIQRATLNIGSKKQKNIDIEGELVHENIKAEKRNVRNTLFAQLFGDVSQAAMNAYGVNKKLPQMEI